MKKLLLFISFLAMSVPGMAQIKTEVFTLDLKAPTAQNALTSSGGKKKLVLKTNELLAFSLIDGNPYRYRYVINHKLVNFFENQQTNPFDSIMKVTATPSAVKPIPVEDNIQEAIEQQEEKIDSINNEIENIGDNKDASAANRKIKLQFDLDQEKKKLEILKKLQKEIGSAMIGSYIPKSRYSTEFLNSVKFNNLLKIYKGVIAKDSIEDKSNIKNAVIVLGQAFEDLNIDITKYIATISTEDFLDADDFGKKRELFNAKYIERLQNLQMIASEASEFPSILDEVNKNFEKINGTSNKMKDDITKMYQLKLHNYMLPVDINGKNIDAVEVTVERYDKTASNPVADKYTYNIWIKNGIKIDVSGGIFLTSLMDKEYETQDKNVEVNGQDVVHKSIFAKDKGAYDIGFGSLINISYRTGNWIRPALSLGALFTTNQKFQLMSGLGVILGKEERIVLHGGLIMGSVSQISDNYKTDGSEAYNLGTAGTVPVNNKFKFGHFFGVTYNFGKVKKQDEAR